MKINKEKLALQMGIVAKRGNTWVGCRPSTMVNKCAKYNKKVRRAEDKALCRNY